MAKRGKHKQHGFRRLHEILTMRVDQALFTPEALTCLAECSSGIPRELIALARQACLEAALSDVAGYVNLQRERFAAVPHSEAKLTLGWRQAFEDEEPPLEALREIAERLASRA